MKAVVHQSFFKLSLFCNDAFYEHFQIKVMTTGGVEESTTNDVNAMDDNGQDLDFLASAFEEVATANETDLFASVDPSLVSFFFA